MPPRKLNPNDKMFEIEFRAFLLFKILPNRKLILKAIKENIKALIANKTVLEFTIDNPYIGILIKQIINHSIITNTKFAIRS
ncbi:hypothetical protein D3C72_2177100 [compost metagenome]